MAKPLPIQQQQPAQPFLNDADGYWNGIASENAATGILSVLPGDTAIQSDTAIKGRLLAGQIRWIPAKARWGNCNLVISISDAQFALTLEEGGETQPGRITVLVEKSQFNTGTPKNGDMFKIQAQGFWHEFVIVEMIGQHDDNEPGLTLYLEKEQNDDGI